MAQGLRVALDCCCEPVGLSRGRRPSGRGAAAMAVVEDREGGGRDGSVVRAGGRLGRREGLGDGLCAHSRRMQLMGDSTRESLRPELMLEDASIKLSSEAR